MVFFQESCSTDTLDKLWQNHKYDPRTTERRLFMRKGKEVGGCSKHKVHQRKLGSPRCWGCSLAGLPQSVTGWTVAGGGRNFSLLLLGGKIAKTV